ncbi:ElyC/SanA/YdcF family protein [Flavobacterium oreochromis]|uniref:ElyC/SanA/YdcF family protein n=1 Tax=Flavobacterium oreochromis TaxID=2906078 RepID=A0ABW8P5C3_9FLAO|nr:ElyC/SanA/YdcF family protein [Flavobacterium oreochromis]
MKAYTIFKKHLKKIILITLIGIISSIGVNSYVKKVTNSLIYNSSKNLPTTSVGIIFGAGIKDDKPSKYLKDRLDAGIRLYQTKKIQKILLSGDNGKEEHDELTVMKTYCYQHGVDTTKIYIDYAGFDSYSTLYRAKSIFKINQAILISQKYHLNRAIFIGNKLGVKSVGYSADKGQYKGYNYVRFREYFSRLKAFIDVLRNRKPKFLGTKIPVEGISNYSKEDKR